MSDKIKISFVEEEVDIDKLSKREKAIYDAAYEEGYAKGRNMVNEMIAGGIIIILIGLVLFAPMLFRF